MPGIRGTPVFLGLSVLVGIDVVVEGDMPSGQWQGPRSGRSYRRWWTAGGAVGVAGGPDEAKRRDEADEPEPGQPAEPWPPAVLEEDEAGCE